jgi:hypothetical protein
VFSVAFSLDGQWAATGGDDKSVRLWSTASWSTVRTLHCGRAVVGVLLTPDSGGTVVETSDDVSVGDVATGRRRCSVPGGNGPSYGTCLSMTPLGDRLAASAADAKSVRVFDSSSLVDVARVPLAAVARTPPAALRRVPLDDLTRMRAGAKACLPPEALARLARQVLAGVARAVTLEGVEAGLVQRVWLPRLPPGVLHRLPPADRGACISFVGRVSALTPLGLREQPLMRQRLAQLLRL